MDSDVDHRSHHEQFVRSASDAMIHFQIYENGSGGFSFIASLASLIIHGLRDSKIVIELTWADISQSSALMSSLGYSRCLIVDGIIRMILLSRSVSGRFTRKSLLANMYLDIN